MRIDEGYLLNNIGPYILKRTGKYSIVTVFNEKRDGENFAYWQDDNSGAVFPIDCRDEIHPIPTLFHEIDEL